MRLLVVYQDFAQRARELVEHLGVTDVTVVIAQKGEASPGDKAWNQIDASRTAAAAICQVNRKYRQAITSAVNIEYEAKRFRSDDRQLEAWLRNKQPASIQQVWPTPSAVFTAHAESCTRFLLAEGALDHADELDQSRWSFTKKAADLLLRHVQSQDTGPMREWKRLHGVDFAPNGKVRFECCSAKDVLGTAWHLKDGDNTTRERAARVYFQCFSDVGEPSVVIFYVGPHPDDGTFTVHLP